MLGGWRGRGVVTVATGAIISVGVMGALLLPGASRATGTATTGREPAASATGYRDLTAIEAEVSVLKNEVNTLRAQLTSPQPAGRVGAPQSCDATGGEGRERRPVSLTQAHERAISEGQRMDDRLAAEARDPGWASDYEQTLRRATDSSLSDRSTESLTRVECRNSMCRLEVRHPDSAHEAEFQTRFRVAMPDVIYRASQIQNADGSQATLLHILRKGQQIPSDTEALPQ